MTEVSFVSRGGIKLQHALVTFQVSVENSIILDVGSSTGGFVDCLLQHGAVKVFSVDTAYGELAWKLRKDPRVVVMERQNILRLESLPEQVDLVTVDVTFTSLTKISPVIKKFLKPGGKVIALLKPQYENQDLALKNKGVIPEEERAPLIKQIEETLENQNWNILAKTESPIKGKDGNTEYLLFIVQS